MPERIKLLENWLTAECGIAQFKLKAASADASFRRYFRASLPDGRSYIVMDAPPDKENCKTFVAISRQFDALGLNVPSVYAENHELGFLLLKDLGDTLYLDILDDSNVEQLYGNALSALKLLQATADPSGLPKYDRKLLMAEMELFREWLLQKHLGIELSDEENRMLDETFALLADNALQQPQVCVHRDYHSRNLMQPPAGDSGPVPGIIDFQDAVEGPITYDPVSLLKDCYIAWPREKVVAWAMSYCQQCIESGLLGPEHEASFLRWFDLMGVQRHLKAAGIFARLSIRDGKDGYLKDIPRTLGYIQGLEGVYSELENLIRLVVEKGL